MENMHIVDSHTMGDVGRNFLGNHPLVGLFLIAIQLAGSLVVKEATETTELPVIVMQLFQVGAWTGAMAAAVFTCLGVYRAHLKKDKVNKSDNDDKKA